MNNEITPLQSPVPVQAFPPVVSPVNTSDNISNVPAPHRLSSAFKKRLWGLSLFALLIVSSLAVYFLFSKNLDFRSRASLSGPSMSLVPATKTVTPDEVFSLGVLLNTSGETVSAVEVSISYDPALIEVTGFTEEKILPVVLSPFSNNQAGVSTVVLGVDPSTPYKGVGTLGNFKVKKKGVATALIKFSTNSKVAVLNKNVNVLGTTNTSTVDTQTAVNPATVSPTQSALKASPAPTLAATNSIKEIIPASFPDGSVGKPYTANIIILKTPKSGNPSIAIDNLPFGLHNTSCTESVGEDAVTCTIGGVPLAVGSKQVQIVVVDENDFRTEKSMDLSIK